MPKVPKTTKVRKPRNVEKESDESSEQLQDDVVEGQDNKRARGRPRKAATEKKAAKRADTPDYHTAFEASKSYVTLDFMLKEHAKGVKDASKAKSDAGKLLKTYFERNPTVDSLGAIECTRKPKKVVPNLDDLKQKVEDEVMQDPLRTGQLLAVAITERITKDGQSPEAPVVSIKINKEAQAAIANTHQQYMFEEGEAFGDQDNEEQEADEEEEEAEETEDVEERA